MSSIFGLNFNILVPCSNDYSVKYIEFDLQRHASILTCFSSHRLTTIIIQLTVVRLKNTNEGVRHGQFGKNSN